MSSENVLDFYKELGFEEIDVEDGLTAFFIETASDGSYALLTDDNGVMPLHLRKVVVVFACYSSAGAFLWSSSFKNSFLFKDIWLQAEDIAGKLAAIKLHREQNEIF